MAQDDILVFIHLPCECNYYTGRQSHSNDMHKLGVEKQAEEHMSNHKSC